MCIVDEEEDKKNEHELAGEEKKYQNSPHPGHFGDDVFAFWASNSRANSVWVAANLGLG